MAKTLKGRTQHPAYTAAVLKAKNPVLLKGEVVYESDTTRHKIGDGTTAWNALPYAKGDFDGPLAAEKVTQDATHRFVSDTEKTAWNGKAAKDLSNVTLTKTFSQNGYYKAPDGLMFQWGRLGTAPSGTSYLSRYVTFPTSFTATPLRRTDHHRGAGRRYGRGRRRHRHNRFRILHQTPLYPRRRRPGQLRNGLSMDGHRTLEIIRTNKLFRRWQRQSRAGCSIRCTRRPH